MQPAKSFLYSLVGIDEFLKDFLILSFCDKRFRKLRLRLKRGFLIYKKKKCIS